MEMEAAANGMPVRACGESAKADDGTVALRDVSSLKKEAAGDAAQSAPMPHNDAAPHENFAAARDMRPPLLVVSGPTASGKTGLAVALAERLGGEVICADSMQVYRDMPVGTAAPTPRERRGVPHHLFEFLSPGERFSVARYAELAGQAARGVASRGRLPILCGGTGLYIAALTGDIAYSGEIPENPELRAVLREEAKSKGNLHIWQQLREADPALAEGLHPNNLGRVIRALEVCRASGVPMSEWQRRARQGTSPFQSCVLVLTYRDRELLYRRIDARADDMLARGLADEARRLAASGIGATAAQAIGHKELAASGIGATAAQAIGHKELAAYLRGEQSLAQAADALKRSTRRYAKRQLTWLRGVEGAHWLEADTLGSPEAVLEAALAVAQEWMAAVRQGK